MSRLARVEKSDSVARAWSYLRRLKINSLLAGRCRGRSSPCDHAFDDSVVAGLLDLNVTYLMRRSTYRRDRPIRDEEA